MGILLLPASPGVAAGHEVVSADGSGIEIRWVRGAAAMGPAPPLRVALPPRHVLRLEWLRAADGTDLGAVAAHAVQLLGVGWHRDQAFQEVRLDDAALASVEAVPPFSLRLEFAPAAGPLPARGAALTPTDADPAAASAGPRLPAAPPWVDVAGVEPTRGAGSPSRAPAALFLNAGTVERDPEALRESLVQDRPSRPERGSLQRRIPASAGERRGPWREGLRTHGLEGGRVRIAVAEDGIYRVTHDQLTAAGIDLAGTRADELRLTTGWASQVPVEVALRVVDAGADGQFSPGDHFEFFGQALVGEERPGLFQGADSTDVNAYFLSALAGPRLRMATTDATPAGAPPAADFLATTRVEVNNVFLGNHRVGTFDVDHYYWCPSLLWSGGPDTLREESVALPGLGPASARTAEVRVQVLARTSLSTVNPDHRSIVEVNGVSVSDRTADGYVVELHEATALPAAGLTDPVRVGIRLPGVAGVTTDRFELDWIEVAYPRRFEAVGGRLLFDHAGGVRVSVSALPTTDVTWLDVSDPFRPVLLTGLVVGPGTADADLDAAAAGPHAIASHPAGAPTFVPRDIAWAPDPGLRDGALDVDVVVVGPRAWLDPPLPALARWVADREAQGLPVLLVPTETMVDEFAEGWFSPFALSFMLAEAFATWAGPPEHVLLLGDATLDWKDQTGSRNLQPSNCMDFVDPCGFDELAWVQHVPTRVVDSPQDQTFLGYYATDVALTMVVGMDLIPDVTVGRIPARTAAEAEMLLDRVLAYEALAASPPAWAPRILHVGDKAGPSEGAIEGSLEEAHAEFVPAAYPRSRLFYQSDYGAMNPTTFTDDLVATWTDPTLGPGILCYVGHGNTFRLSNDLLFGNREANPTCRDDVTRVTGALVPQPFVLNANCISGGFMHLLGPSLLEELVRAQDGAAIAAFGPTGITDLALSRTILDAFHAAVHGPDGRGLRLGEVAFRIHVALAGNGALDELQNNTLLGDPTLRLLVPTGPPALALRAAPGDAVVSLDWDAVPGATDYRLHRSESGPGGPWIELVTVPAAQVTHDDVTALNGRLYHYALEPLDGAWPGRWSERVSARPCTPAPPEPPGAVNAVAQPVPGSFRLTWGASPTPDLQRYVIRIYRGRVAAGRPEQVRTSSVTLASVTGLAPCGEYTFEVRAVSWCDRESLTGSEAFRIAQPCPVAMDPPATIRDLRVRRQGPTDLELSWTPVTTTVAGTPAVIDHHRVNRAARPDFFVAPLVTEIGRVPGGVFPDPARVGSGTDLEFYLVAAATPAGETGAYGHDLPQGVSGLQSTPVGADYMLTWNVVTRDIQGWAAPIARYHVFASASPLDRLAVEGRVPDLTVTGPPATVPQALGGNHFVLAEDVHGNRGAW